MGIPSWVPDTVFYLIFPDRFARSGKSAQVEHLEAWDSPPTQTGFKGGDLYGIAEKLEYLSDLGVTAILLNPVFASSANHRYHTIDYFSVDTLLGGNRALRHLIDSAHARGMKVILDAVFNHTGRGFYQFVHTLENGGNSLYVDWFHFNKDWLREGRQLLPYPQKEGDLDTGDDSLALNTYGYKSWWNLPGLPKLNTSNPEVRSFLLGVARHWVEFGADGWRLDVPSEISDDSFWQEFRATVKGANPDAYIVGEIWDDGSRWLKGDQFDAVMNYMLTKSLVGYLTGRSFNRQEILRCGGYRHVHPLSDAEFRTAIESLVNQYPVEITQAQLNLLDSHDTARFINCAGGDTNALKLAILFFMTFPGAPCIYYGDEIGLAGGADPECRRSFPWDDRQWNFEIRSFYKKCIDLRKRIPAFRRGDFKVVLSKDGVFAFERTLEGSAFLVIFNTTGNVRRIPLTQHSGLSSSFEDCWTGHVYVSGRDDVYLEPQVGLVLKRLDNSPE